MVHNLANKAKNECEGNSRVAKYTQIPLNNCSKYILTVDIVSEESGKGG